MKLKLGHKFFLFIHRFKIEIFLNVGLPLDFRVLVFPISPRNFGTLKCWSGWTSQFLPIHETDGKLGFKNISQCYTSKFLPIH